MSGKRKPTSDINQDNWDEIEEPEDPGNFRTASEEEIGKRVIKKARRRIAGLGASDNDSTESTGTKKIFGTFQGFAPPPKPSTSSGPAGIFSFLSKLPQTNSSDTPAVSSSTAEKTSVSSATTATSAFGTMKPGETTDSSPAKKPMFSFGTSAPNFSFAGNSATTNSSLAKNDSTSTKATFSFANPLSKQDGNPSTSANSNFNFSGGSSQPVSLGKTNTTSAADEKDVSGGIKKSPEYIAKLLVLNKSFIKWLDECYEKNSVCLFTNICKEYIQFAEALDGEEKEKSSQKATGTMFKIGGGSEEAGRSSSTGSSNTAPSSEPPKTNGFSFGLSKEMPSTSFGFGNSSKTPIASKEGNKQQNTVSIFGAKSDAEPSSSKLEGSSTEASKPKTAFSFGSSFGEGSSNNPISGFSFTPGAQPFTFGNLKPPAAPSTTEQDEDENDEPPKVEFKQVVEDDAVYSKKCKVFIKKDNAYTDRGVGTLYLKPVPNSSKAQLLVRADTNLGNILLNFILNEALPTQRQGKNNVMIVCLPTPEAEKPSTILVRVKTAEDADELLKEIEKYKK